MQECYLLHEWKKTSKVGYNETASGLMTRFAANISSLFAVKRFQ